MHTLKEKSKNIRILPHSEERRCNIYHGGLKLKAATHSQPLQTTRQSCQHTDITPSAQQNMPRWQSPLTSNHSTGPTSSCPSRQPPLQKSNLKSVTVIWRRSTRPRRVAFQIRCLAACQPSQIWMDVNNVSHSNMGTKKNNHTDPICFRCFESDFRWYFQWTFLKIKKRWQNKKKLKNVKNVPWIKKRKKRFFTSMVDWALALVVWTPLPVYAGHNLG